MLEVTAVDVYFVAWKSAMSSANNFFSLAWRIAISPAMNPSLLIAIGEGTVGGRVVVRWFTLLEFAAERMCIFNCFFSLAQKIAISLAINSLQCSIVIVGLVGSCVKETVGEWLTFNFLVIVFGFIVIVVVFVIVGWCTTDGLMEVRGVGTGGGVGVNWVTRVGWLIEVGLLEVGQFWWW